VKGLSVLWARSKIADLEERRFDRNSATKIDKQILKTALDHHLVSRLTSLVAVDITPSRDMSGPLRSLQVPTQLPEGWDFGKLAAAPSSQQTANSSSPQSVSAPRRTAPMPSTASPHILMTLLGLLLMLFGVIMHRRRDV